MYKKIYLLLILVSILLIGCGIPAPQQDLDLAKANIAKLDNVEAKKFAADDYNKAKELLKNGEATMVPEKSGKNKDALALLLQANSKASNTYKKAAPEYAKHYIDDTKGSSDKANDIKANVAVKDDYKKAEDALKEAKACNSKQDYEKAGKKAKEAKILYEKAYEKAAKKKAKSDKAIKEANDALKELEN